MDALNKNRFLNPDRVRTNVKIVPINISQPFRMSWELKSDWPEGEEETTWMWILIHCSQRSLHRSTPKASVSWVTSSKSHNKSLNHQIWLAEKSTSYQVTLKLSILMMSLQQRKHKIWFVPSGIYFRFWQNRYKLKLYVNHMFYLLCII